MANRADPQERIELHGILAEFRDALEEEIFKIKKNGQSSTVLSAGQRIENQGTETWYRFRVEYAPSIPADTPCKLIIGKETFDVVVVSFEENTIILSAKEPLPDTIAKAYLENGAVVLMERLIKRIEESAQERNDAGEHMLPHNKESYSYKKVFTYDDLILKKGNTPNQNKAIESALSNDITYIWGPPGTGKTSVIGQIIEQLFQRSRSVLVVSHTNTAVDGAIEKADMAYSSSHDCKESASYPILRMGVPVKRLPERVLLSHHISLLGRELYEQKAALEKKQEMLQKHINELRPLIAKVLWRNESKLRDIETALNIIAELKEETKRIEGTILTIEAEIQKEKERSPECEEYPNVLNIIQVKKTEYDKATKRLKKLEAQVEEFPLSIQRAQDEARKHDVYKRLREKEAQYMSDSFLSNEIERITKRIEELTEEISQLEEKQTVAQRVVRNYNQKSSLGKLFSGRTSFLQAKSDLTQISIRLPQAKDERNCQLNLRMEYRQQLEAVLLLQEQIRAVFPTETQEYWEARERKLQEDFATLKEKFEKDSA